MLACQVHFHAPKEKPSPTAAGRAEHNHQPPLSDSPKDLKSGWQEALRLWLRWNDAYEKVCEVLFQSRGDPQKLEQLMDRKDQIRQQAVELSRKLLQR
jgi:hypothetical protein